MPKTESNLAVAEAPVINPDNLPRSYMLFYRYPSTRPLEKAFYFSGPLAEAIQRGREHCEIMGCKFICVRPDIVDLDKQEADKRKDPAWAGDRNFD
jgi:hypothetical protein